MGGLNQQNRCGVWKGGWCKCGGQSYGGYLGRGLGNGQANWKGQFRDSWGGQTALSREARCEARQCAAGVV